jgi:hypothetical protein
LTTVEGQLTNLDTTYATDAQVSSAVSAEAALRTTAVAGVQADVDAVASDLSDEATARAAADSGLAQDIADETSARETAVSGLASDISDVVADLSTEVSRATAAESALSGRVTTVEGTLAALDATYATDAQVTAAVAAETTARIAANTAGGAAVSAALTSEASTRLAADNALDARLDTIEANHPRKYAVAVGDGSATSFTVTHDLGSTDVVVSVRDASTGAVVVAAVTHSTNSTVTVAVNGTAPANNALKVVVIG